MVKIFTNGRNLVMIFELVNTTVIKSSTKTKSDTKNLVKIEVKISWKTRGYSASYTF